MEGAEIDIAKRDALVLANIPFVHSRIREKWHHLKNSDHYEDAVSEGIIGLFEAAERYDDSMDNTFITYAVHWIDNQIRRYDDKRKQPVYLPANRNYEAKLLARAYRKSGSKQALRLSDLMPSDAPYPPGYVMNVLAAKAVNTNIYLDSPCPSPDPFQRICDQEAKRIVMNALASLDSRTQKMVLSKYGFHGEEMTLEQISIPWKLTRERVRQILGKCERNLRKNMPHSVRRELYAQFFTEENTGIAPRWAPDEATNDPPDLYFAVPQYGHRFDCPCCGSRIHSQSSYWFECHDCGYDRKASPDCPRCGETVLIGFPCYCDYLTPSREQSLRSQIHRILLLAGGCTLDRLMAELEDAGFKREHREVLVKLQRDVAVLKGADGSYYLRENAPQRLLDLDRLERKLERLDAEFEARSQYLAAQIKVVRQLPERASALRQEMLAVEEEYLKAKEELLISLETLNKA